MTFVSELLTRLVALGKRARTDDDKPDLTPAIGVIGDLGRLITKSAPDDIKVVQAAVASLREALDRDRTRNHPTSALAGAASREYLAGAMWAMNEVMTARLDALEAASTLPGRQTRKSAIEQVVLTNLDRTRGTSPTHLMGQPAAREIGIKNYEISRILGDLISRDLVKVVAAAEDADRRNRYFALTDLGTVAVGSSQSPASVTTSGAASSATGAGSAESAETREVQPTPPSRPKPSPTERLRHLLRD